MSKLILDIYTDYLICQNNYATATGLSDLTSGNISHDKITKFLNSSDMNSKDLWLYIKKQIRQYETSTGGILILDDSIEEKPYTDENDIVSWHYSHTHNRHVKGINIISCLVEYDKISLPVGYEIIHKNNIFKDKKTKKIKRKANISKNEHFRNIISQCIDNKVLFDHVIADNWFGSVENMKYIHRDIKKYFIIGIKSNRTIALSMDDKISGKFQKVSLLDIKDGESKKVWLKGLNFRIKVIKKVFTNEDNSTSTIYLASNDLEHNVDYLYQIYQKRWNIEIYHKSLKQNTSLAKSPTKIVRS